MKEVIEKDFQKKFNPTILDLFRTQNEGEPYLTTPEGGTLRVVSAEFKELLWKMHYQAYGKEPSCCLVNKTIKHLYMYGRTLVPVKKVHRRVAGVGNEVSIDMATPDTTAIKITGDSIKIEPTNDIKFVRSRGQKALFVPSLDCRPEYLNLLKKYIPFKSEDDFVLFVSWLLGCLNSNGGYPILFLNGEQGAGKSTACRLIKSLLDPSRSVLRNFPKSEKELMIAASNDFNLCFDNTSKITDKQSDNLCKLALGTSLTTRRLYSTAAEVHLYSKNPCVINGIGCIPTRQDLLDRSVIVSLDFIPSSNRMTEKELMASWEQDRALIFGALCQAVSAAIKNYDSVSERKLPRMADFAKWIIAAEEMLPWLNGKFMNAIQNQRYNMVTEALDTDPVTMAVLSLMEHRDAWTGRATELLDVLAECIDQDRRKYPGFPKIPNHLSQRLNRTSAFLREKGILFERGHSGTRSITLSKIVPEEGHQSWEGPYTKDSQDKMEAVQPVLPAHPQSNDSITSSDESGPSTATETETDF